MATARHPARQLNSKAIKDVIISYMIPAVQKTFFVVKAKATWRVEKDANNLTKAWELVCEKRAECDKALEGLGNLAFYFSSISSSEPPSKSKKKITGSDSALEEEDSEMLPHSQQLGSHRLSSSITVAVEEGRYPAISYWMAFASPNGAPISLAPIRRKLINCEVEVDVKVLSNSRRQVINEMAKSLCNVVKDHNSSFMTDIVDSSYEYCRQVAISDLEEERPFSEDEDECTESVLKFSLLKPSHGQEIHDALQALTRAGLKMDLQGVEMTEFQAGGSDESTSIRSLTSDQPTQLIHDIERLMTKLGYALHRGMILRKEKKAVYTYTEKCNMNSFIGTLEGNEAFKSRLSKYGKQVKEKLQNTETQFIKQMKIDHDLIEVNKGWCLCLSKREFLQHAVHERDIGHVSPRAFCPYDHNKQPDPKYFRQILENSLNQEQIKQFCTDYIELLQFQKKQHKQKVPCLVGEADSGKTSLLAPIFGIVPTSRIAKVTKQKAFNKALIDEETEVILIDEAYVGMMDVDDWKIVTQGGWNVHDMKYSKARPVVNRCPMLIACQKELEFPDEEDQKAMDARLNVYHFKQLAQKEKGAFEWLKRNPLDCIVWAMRNAKESETAGVDGEDAKQGQLTDADKEELLAFDLEEATCETKEQEPDDDDAEGEEQEEPDSQTERLREAWLAETNPFRKRVYEKILARTAQQRSDEEEVFRRGLDKRRSWLVELGVEEDVAQRMPEDEEEPWPDTLKRAVDGCVSSKREQEEIEKKRKAEEVYQGTWLLDKERELVHLSKELNSSGIQLEEDTRMGKEYFLEVLVDAIKLHHRSAQTDPAHGVAIRRKLYVQQGWINVGQEGAVVNLYAPPCLYGESNVAFGCESTSDDDGDDDNCDDDERPELSQLTPPTSQTRRKRRSATQRVSVAKQQKITYFFSQ